MSHTAVKIIGILLFALAAALLYGWGVIKSQNQQKDLYNILFSKGIQTVKNYLKTKEYITFQETQNQVAGIKATQFYSRKRAVVQNKKDFSRNLLDTMVEKNILIEDKVHGKVVYRLREQEKK